MNNQTNFSNFQSVAARSLALNTLKTYRSCIRRLQEKLTDEQKAEYLDDSGKLIKPLEGNIASNIVHQNQN